MLKSVSLSYLLFLLSITFGFSQSGTLDSTFSEDGIVSRDIGTGGFDLPYGGALQKDGKVLIVGITGGNFTVIRYLPDGTPDSTFSADGLVNEDFDGSEDRCHAVTIQPDGKIILAGETQVGGQPDFALLRLHPDGRPDSTFGVNGWTTTDLGADFEFPNCVAVQLDGKIIAAGKIAVGFTSDFTMIRYHTDGTLDTLFGEQGIVTTSFRDEDEAFAIAIQPDQRIILAGFGSVSASGDFAVGRYLPDGTLDKSFGIGGKVLTDLEGTDRSDFIRAMVLQPDGKILVAGNANQVNQALTSDAGMARYNRNGVLDTTFGIAGKYIIRFGDKTDINCIALQPDGKILLGGNSNVITDQRWLLARFGPNAGLDTSFGNMGIMTTNMPGFREFGNALFVQPDSRIIMTGAVGISPNLDFAAARYIADFTLSFSAQGVSCYGLNDGSITVNAEGGTAPYEFSMDGGLNYQTDNLFPNLDAGSYIITIRDADGRIGAMGPIEVSNQPLPPSVEVIADQDDNIIEIIVEGEPEGYQYSIDGGVTFHSENIFTDLADGIYQVVVADQNGCNIHTEQVTISTLSVASHDRLKFTISPNPGDGLFTLDLGEIASGLNLQIADLTGRVVYTSSMDASKAEIQKLDLRFLPEGNYLLRIRDGENWGVRKLIIVK